MSIRYWNGKNRIKFYNEHHVLRFEMTMNDPRKYKIYRHAENQDKTEPKKFMPIRKGISEIRSGINTYKNQRYSPFKMMQSIEKIKKNEMQQ